MEKEEKGCAGHPFLPYRGYYPPYSEILPLYCVISSRRRCRTEGESKAGIHIRHRYRSQGFRDHIHIRHRRRSRCHRHTGSVTGIRCCFRRSRFHSRLSIHSLLQPNHSWGNPPKFVYTIRYVEGLAFVSSSEVKILLINFVKCTQRNT